jgi:hypothetical protein
MLYKALAEAVVLLHFLWIVFLVLGAFPGARYRGVKYLHLGGLGFAVVMQAADWYCPLTHLEVWLRRRHDPALDYGGSFIVHYLEEIVYLDVSRGAIFGLTIALCAFNAWMYLKKRPHLL